MPELADLTQNGIAVGGVSVGVIIAIALYLRKVIKDMGLEDTHRSSEQTSVALNDKVLKNIQDELERHAKRIQELESKVEELTTKLANVRMVAIDCYSLASECECASMAKDKLLEHLKQIIREA